MDAPWVERTLGNAIERALDAAESVEVTVLSEDPLPAELLAQPRREGTNFIWDPLPKKMKPVTVRRVEVRVDGEVAWDYDARWTNLNPGDQFTVRIGA